MKKTISLILCLALAAIFLTGCVSIRFAPGNANSVTGRGGLVTVRNVGEN